MEEPPAGLRDRVEQALGHRWVVGVRPDCGLSAAHRFAVTFDDGTSAFVKAAVDDATEGWLRTEHVALSQMEDSGLAPGVVAWLDEPGQRPILVSEDLSGAYWPASHAGVNWRDGDFGLVFAGVQELKSLPAPAGLRGLTNRSEPLWPSLASNDGLLTEHSICSPAWLDAHHGRLAEAEMSVDISGDALVHGDLRSDNMCLGANGAIFVDWSNAARGNPECDLAQLVPTLHLEGGPHPFHAMPGGGAWAAFQSADLLWRLKHEVHAPAWLRAVFAKLVAIELEWAALGLGFDPPHDRHEAVADTLHG